VIDGKDRQLSRKAASREIIIGSRVEVFRLASSEMIFSGRIAELDPEGDLAWSIGLKPRDSRLSSKVPGHLFNDVIFPNVDRETVLGVIAPWCWGLFDAKGTGATGGSLPMFLVDRLRFKYTPGVGWYRILRVYRNKTLLTPAMYLVTNEIIDGLRWTTIKFPVNQRQAVITADIYGFLVDPEAEPSKPGTPASDEFVNGAGAVAVNALANCFLEDRSLTGFQATHADIDTTAFTDYDTDVGYKASIYLNEETTGYEALTELCKTTGWRLSWTNDGKLTVDPGFVPPDSAPVGDPWMRDDSGDILHLERALGAQASYEKLKSLYGPVPADAKAGFAQEVVTPFQPGELAVTSRYAPSFA